AERRGRWATSGAGRRDAAMGRFAGAGGAAGSDRAGAGAVAAGRRPARRVGQSAAARGAGRRGGARRVCAAAARPQGGPSGEGWAAGARGSQLGGDQDPPGAGEPVGAGPDAVLISTAPPGTTTIRNSCPASSRMPTKASPPTAATITDRQLPSQSTSAAKMS